MAKKKAIKLATATAIAASAFAAAAPVQTSAAVNVDTVVKNAVKKMVAAQNSFVAKATDKKLVDVKTVQANQAAATKEYTAAKATVKKSGGKNTAALNAKLDAAKKTMDYRIKMYVDARKEVSALAVVNQATKKEADIAKLEGKVKELEAQIAKTEKLVAKVIGTSTRDKMTAMAVTPSKATLKASLAKIEAAKTLKVESVSAINATTLKITGNALSKLKAEDITVASNVVSSVAASEDGKTATVTLSGTLPAGQDVKVSVKIGETTTDFKVNFSLAAKTVSIKDAVYDDDTKGQKLGVVVDGVETTVDYLLSSGYSVVFNAYDKDGKIANTDFFGNATSTDGKLNSTAPIPQGDYTATVVIAKDSTVLTSTPAKITVRNIDNAATAISKYNFFLDKAVVKTVDDTDVELNSKTLVIGESAYVGTVTLGVGSAATEVAGNGATSIVKLKSSNEAIVSVDKDGFLKAEGVGTATITMTVGKVTQTFTVTVNGTERKATKIEASNSKHIINSAIKKVITVTDQYGDPFDGATGLEFVAPTSVTGFTATPVAITADHGDATLTIGTPTTANQSGTVVVRKVSDKSIVGSFVVTTTAINNVGSTKLIYAGNSESSDDVLTADLASDDTVTYLLRDYTPENVTVKTYTTAGDYTGYTVKFNGKVVSVNSDATGEYTMKATDTNIALAIKGAGSTTVAIYDANGKFVDQKTVTVQQAATKITGVTWKTVPVINYTTTIDYKTVLDITEGVTGTDPIVKGITLSSPVANSLRIATAPGGTIVAGDIYIDRNDDGKADAGDTLLGKLTYASTSSSTGAIAGLTNIVGTTAQPVAVGTPAKGFINFSITDETSSDTTKPVVSTKSVEVNVK